jgi:hydroxymethylglutaryl-CoA lyase
LAAADVRVCEVGLRDGLQLQTEPLATADKVAWIRAEAAVGMPEIEVTSLVPASLLPQFADAADVVAAALAIEGLTVAVLAPNLRGAERAFELGAHVVNVVTSVSETHSRRNVRRSPAESIAEVGRIAAARAALPVTAQPRLRAGIATALGCSYEGTIPVDAVRRHAAALAAAGPDEILIADTVGYGDPVRVRAVLRAVAAEIGDLPIVAHFHDTRGLGLANVVAALDCNVRAFDASLGGLGGCPFAPGATGNIVMEDLVFMLESMGLATGVDLPGLLGVRTLLGRYFDPGDLHGALSRAGLPRASGDPPEGTT